MSHDPRDPLPCPRGLARRLAADRGGATGIEYGLIAAGVALAIMLSVFAAGSTLNQGFEDAETQLASAGTGDAGENDSGGNEKNQNQDSGSDSGSDSGGDEGSDKASKKAAKKAANQAAKEANKAAKQAAKDAKKKNK